MALKSGIFTLVLGALLVGSTASAQDAQQNMNAAPNELQAQGWQGGGSEPYRWDDDHGHDGHERRRDRRGLIEVHVHTDRCHHGPQPTPPRNQQGRYELQLVQKWFPGRYEQVWVPQECRTKERRRTTVTKCKGGYYEQRWVDGRYETVEEWVWVSTPVYHRGPAWGTPASHWN